ncbi:uncharacterized protein LOC119327581 [Triticum dicoccoides]|uniref:uncharacterized protein LOC119327581 n=1 Tax=Triticum dicoccoides TaxID=85692 RepID=UPI001890F087|nr:uncharacterized protein LOC119327581 [Triticum dicoccoides]
MDNKAALEVLNNWSCGPSEDQLGKFGAETRHPAAGRNTIPEVPPLDCSQTSSNNLEILWDCDSSHREKDYGEGWSTDEEMIDRLWESPTKITPLSKKKKLEWQYMENFTDEFRGPDCKVSGIPKQACRHAKISGQESSSAALSIKHVLPTPLQQYKAARATNNDHKESIMDLYRGVDMLYHFMRDCDEKLENLHKKVMVLCQAVKKKVEWQYVVNFTDELPGPDCKVSGLPKQPCRQDKISGERPSSTTQSIKHVLPTPSQEYKVARATNQDQTGSIIDLYHSVDMLYHFIRDCDEKLEYLQKTVVVLGQAVANSALPPPSKDQA